MVYRPMLVSEAAQHFWEACQNRRLEMPQCANCGRLCWYPQPVCPNCWHDRFGWVELSGRARLYSYTVVHRAFDSNFTDAVPYLSAIVEPVEDDRARLVSRLVDCSPDSLVIGADLALTFTEEDGIVYPFFSPAR
jgi:uncharacterized protein